MRAAFVAPVSLCVYIRDCSAMRAASTIYMHARVWPQDPPLFAGVRLRENVRLVGRGLPGLAR